MRSVEAVVRLKCRGTIEEQVSLDVISRFFSSLSRLKRLGGATSRFKKAAV